MKRWHIWTGILIIFLSGVIVGVLGTGLYIHSRVVSILHGGPAAFDRAVLQALDWKLDLSEEQEAAVSAEIKAAHDEIRSFRAQHHPRIEAIFEKSFDRVKDMLTPEQQEKLEAMRRDIEAHVHGMHGMPKEGAGSEK